MAASTRERAVRVTHSNIGPIPKRSNTADISVGEMNCGSLFPDFSSSPARTLLTTDRVVRPMLLGPLELAGRQSTSASR